MTVFRNEIAAAIRDAFDQAFSSPTREELVDIAQTNRASAETVGVLRRLPNRRFARLDEIWTYLDRHSLDQN